jgi:L-ascorbate metabolism protein UlaG (beta-lactamase superfamily)
MRAMRPPPRLRHLLPLAAALVACTPSEATPPADPPPPAPPPPAAPPPAAPPASAAAAAPSATASAEPRPQPTVTDTIATSAGDVKITPVHHGTVMLEHGGKIIWIDPWSQGPLDGLPKADLVLITDIHQDHYDPPGLEKVKKDGTTIVAPAVVAEKVPGAVVMKNGETKKVAGLSITAVPMYNKQRGPAAGQLFHDKGRGNGYVVAFGDKRLYFAGDTECIDEMKALKKIAAAFVCMNLPYTMPPSEAAECIKAFRPKIVFPYHFRGSNLDELTQALAGEKGIELRVRRWY